MEAGLADEVLVMSVEPGFGGQAYMAEVEEKLLVWLWRVKSLSGRGGGGHGCDGCGRAGFVVATSKVCKVGVGEKV